MAGQEQAAGHPEPEEWREVAGVVRTDVSNQGHVRRRDVDDCVLAKRAAPVPTGALAVWLTLASTGRQIRVPLAKLVWEAFVGPVPAGKKVAPRDRRPRNLAVGNLHLVPAKGSPSVRLTPEQVQDIRRAAIDGDDPKEIAARMGLQLQRVRAVLYGISYSRPRRSWTRDDLDLDTDEEGEPDPLLG